MKKCVYYTTCPECYDYPDTKCIGVVAHAGNKPVRKVMIPTRKCDYQIARYWSGLGLNANEHEFASLCDAQLVTLI